MNLLQVFDLEVVVIPNCVRWAHHV